MNNDITTEERIDNYLLGRMTEAERAAFERELATDADLKEEYECQKAIARAVQKVAMKDFLTQHAAVRKIAERPAAANIAESNANVINLTSLFSRISEKVQGVFSSGQRIAWTLASVAAMVVAIVGSVNYTSTLHTMQGSGMLAYAELSAPVARDGNELDTMIEDAYVLIGEGDMDKATDAIEKAKAKVSERLAQPVETEEDEYEHQVLQLKKYDLEWYGAIVLMKQGKVIKAKRTLEAIATSSSPYADTARNELNNIFKVKSQ